MKAYHLARAPLAAATLFVLFGCTEGGGFTGVNNGLPGGGGAGGGGAGGGGPTVTSEPRLAHQPEAGTALFDLALAGDASRVIFVSDQNPLGQNPTGGEQIFAVDIGQGDIHRVQNEGDCEMVFIEVQLGEYFGEDDIERLEDDYGRLGQK